MKFNISPFYSLQNSNLKHSYGIQLGIEYYSQPKLSYGINFGIFSPENNLNGKFLVKMPTTIGWIDFTIKKYFIDISHFPYLGAGIGRFFLNRERHGNADVESIVFNGNLDNTFGYHLVVGFSLYGKLHLELKYNILWTKMDRTINSAASNISDKENINVNLSTLFIIFGFKL